MFHAGANTLNDYCDLKNGIDTPQAPTALYRPHPVFSKIMTARELLGLSALLLAGAFLIGAIFAFYITPKIWGLLAAGMFLAIFYTGKPLGLKYTALGELTVFFAFGPLMIEGSYAVQKSAFSLKALYTSVPIGLLISLILLANNLRDADFDAKQNIKTISTLLNQTSGLKLYAALSLLPFILIAGFCFLGVFSPWALLVCFSLPLALRLIKEFSHKIPLKADAKTSELATLFGLLFIVALIAEKITPHITSCISIR
jgi:1,4-dihydroxy-2-naphthoate octaprenyltransferase